MKVIDKYLRSEYDNKNWSCILFDFDHVIIFFREHDLSDNILIPFYRLMTKRKKEKKDIVTCAKELGYKTNFIFYLFENLYKSSKLNKKLIDHIINLKKINKKTIITSNNTVNFINFILLKYNLTNLFDLVYTPELSNWYWKPDKKYFINLKIKYLKKYNFEDMLLIDDDIKNIDVFKKLNGGTFQYTKDYPL